MTSYSLQPASDSHDFASLDFGQHGDRDLTRRIVDFLVSHALLNGASVRLKVDRGHIELGGSVATFRQKERIEAFIRRVAGVINVTNQLAVGPLPQTVSSGWFGHPARAHESVAARLFQE
jgi:osmotically-inducible protein OsmY